MRCRACQWPLNDKHIIKYKSDYRRCLSCGSVMLTLIQEKDDQGLSYSVNPDTLVESWRHHLYTGDVMYLTVPNILHFYFFKSSEYISFFTKDGLFELLHRHGFRIKKPLLSWPWKIRLMICKC